MTYSYSTPTEQYPRSPARTSGALIAADIVALIGIVVGSVALFIQGWVHAKIIFMSRGPTGAQILQPFGVDIDRELSQIADRQINATISPTMWQYKSHAFQYLFALLVVTGVLLLLGLLAPRLRVAVHTLALLVSVGAVIVTVVALVRVRDRTDSLPAQVAQAIVNSPAANRVFAATTGKPVLDAKPGWPLYAAVIGVALTLLGCLFALIFAAVRSSRAAAALRPPPPVY